jgi:hypothetical protein
LEYSPCSAQTAQANTIELEFLPTETPVALTSLGRRPSACETRFCTSTAARSMSRSMSKVTVTEELPSEPEDDWMYFMPSTPLTTCSMGVVTADSMTCALAPV